MMAIIEDIFLGTAALLCILLCILSCIVYLGILFTGDTL